MSVKRQTDSAGKSDSLHVVATFQRAIAAAAFVGILDDQGIRAESVGEHTAGFAAEAPGVVEVLVSESDLDRAKAIFVDFEKNGAQVDWSEVDVGDDSPVTDDEAITNQTDDASSS